MCEYDVIIVGACTSGTYFSNLLAFKHLPETEAINKFLENVELIQLLQDYLGDEIRNTEHFAFEGTKESLKHLNDFINQLEFKTPINKIYSEIKGKAIIEELNKIKNKEKK